MFIVLILIAMFGPPILFIALGISERKRLDKKRAKLFFILAVLYLIVGLGVCGSMLTGF